MTPRSLLLFRTVIVAVLSAAAAFHGYLLFGIWLQIESLAGQPISIPVTGIAYLVLTSTVVFTASLLAMALLLRSASTPEGRALAIFLACLVYVTAALESIFTLRQKHQLHWLLDGGLDVTIPLSALLGLAALLRFSSLFPLRLRAEQIAGQAILPRLRTRLLDPRFIWPLAIGLALGIQVMLVAVVRLRDVVPVLGGAGFPLHHLAMVVLVLGSLSMGVANLHTAYGAADAEGRRRVFWVMEGLLAGTLILLLASAIKLVGLTTGYATWFAPWYPLSFILALVVIIAFLGVAMFYVGALDPLLAIRRTATTGMLGLAMVFIFALTQQLVHEYLVNWLSLSDRVGGMLTGGIVALSFEPVQSRMNRAVTGWMKKEKVAPADAPAPVPVQTLPLRA